METSSPFALSIEAMNWMIKIMKWLLSSFDNSTPGASGRKLTAFSLMLCVFYLHYKFVNFSNAFEFLIADLSTIGVLLGIVTAQNVIDLKTKKANEGN